MAELSDAQRRVEIVTRWKRDYDDLSYEDHKQVYREMWATNLQEQAHFDFESVSAAIDFKDATVCEVGGWDGQLAGRVLATEPSIRGWVNFEVCEAAAEVGAQAIRDDRYMTDLEGWVWDCDLQAFDTLIASHSLEHMNMRHVRLLLEATRHMRQAYVQVPNSMQAGSQSTHILGVTHDELDSEFIDAGWALVWARGGHDQVRVWKRAAAA